MYLYCTNHLHIFIIFAILHIPCIFGVELTFELPDNAKQCFYQEIERDVIVTLEFQVISGGRYDVDCKIEDPDGLELYGKKKQQYDSQQWTTQKVGVYKVCFSNEFSTITHKVVYFDWQFGAEAPLLPEMARSSALTQMESNVVSIHEMLNNVMEFQTKFRLREATGRIFATALSEKVQIWSFLQMMILIIVAIGQVVVLRSFFSNTKQHRVRSAT
ncbi:transmembrane emp24 domain-containing protein 7-like [Styela clava]|uniref:transmembrane emp24 domain-containing protein 7-like n=1 Tax=Styela clava TaxID=7725 RepID=UPI00193A9636|nr:transmembrane emp24 domain-containing protein 7-like [Styela clava]